MEQGLATGARANVDEAVAEGDSLDASQRESMEFDVVIVGGGPAGLSAAIRLKQLAQDAAKDVSVCLLEKGSSIGAHILSGAVFEPRALDELLPNWRATLDHPLATPANRDRFCYLTARRAIRLPTPPYMHNRGNFIISLGSLCRWLAAKAESMGVEIFPGFAAAQPHIEKDGSVGGVITGDMGIGKDGARTANYQQGILLRGKQTIFAEGCRGSLGKQLIARFGLAKDSQPQTYGIGLKELWEIGQGQDGRNGFGHRDGDILHTIGWPLDSKTYGGSFLYRLQAGMISIGFVVGLDYANPYLSPYKEFQRFKQHPLIAGILSGSKRISYGARALNEGGYQSIPRLHFRGGLLVGCDAGFMNVAKIKGSHTAMKSGMLAAEEVFEFLASGATSSGFEVVSYGEKVRKSWIVKELRLVRNIRPSFRLGLWLALLYSAIDCYIFRGRTPWTLRHRPDHKHLTEKSRAKKIDYPQADGKLSFDLLTNLSFSGVYHEENQPAHLRLKNPSLAIGEVAERYASPETRYCPANVYEIIEEQGESGAAADATIRLQINAQNCLHCKTCDIKDPLQNIDWITPEGGGGPNYESM